MRAPVVGSGQRPNPKFIAGRALGWMANQDVKVQTCARISMHAPRLRILPTFHESDNSHNGKDLAILTTILLIVDLELDKTDRPWFLIYKGFTNTSHTWIYSVIILLLNIPGRIFISVEPYLLAQPSQPNSTFCLIPLFWWVGSSAIESTSPSPILLKDFIRCSTFVAFINLFFRPSFLQFLIYLNGENLK